MNHEDPVVPHERNLYGQPRDSCVKDSSKKFCRNVKKGRSTELENAYQCIDSKVHSRRSTWNDNTMTGRKQNTTPKWEKINEKNEILTNKHQVLSTYIWDVLNVNAN